MATHSRVLAWRTPGMREPDGLLSMGSHKVRHDWSNLAAAFIGRTDAEAEAPILWPPDAKSRLIGKEPDAGKDWGQEAKGVTEDEMVGWHYRLYGHEFKQTGRKWRTGKSWVLQSMELQRVRHNLATEWQQQVTWPSPTCVSLSTLTSFYKDISYRISELP